MKHVISRRNLLKAAGGAAAGLVPLASVAQGERALQVSGKRIAVSSGNGLRATARAMELMAQGADTLEAAVSGVNIVEEDPNDTSVGYGGLPNERGVVQLDSCVMHGPTYRAGAVASLENIKTPSRVAQKVMERTDHVLLVGPGALEFARAMGFKEEDLLTDRAREAWLRWKANMSLEDDWLNDEERVAGETRPTGTITCLCLNEKGELSGVTTTSGLAFKIPGRVGDSPIIGAGLYVDNDVGAAGSTGRGEANILESGARIAVENMRRGMEPGEACLDVLRRIARRTVDKRLVSEPGKPNFAITFYALRKDGLFGAANMHGVARFAAHDGETNAHRESLRLF